MEKKKKIYIICAIMAFIAVIAAGSLAAVMNSPKVRFVRGISNMAKEVTAYVNPAMKEADVKLLRRNMHSTPYTIAADMTVTFPQSNNVDNVNFSVSAGVDNKSRLACADFTLGAYRLNLAQGNLVVDDNCLYVSIPKLLKDIYSLRLDTIGADYNASAWADQLEISIDENASYDFFAPPNIEYYDWNELMQVLQPDAQSLKEEILIAKAPDKVNVVRDGKTIQCSGISITIPKDAVNTFLDKFQEKFMMSSMYHQWVTNLQEASTLNDIFKDVIEEKMDSCADEILDVRCKNDVTMYLYMDSKNKIVRVVTPDKIEFKDSDVRGMQLTADFTGTDRTLDIIDADYKLDTVNGTKDFMLSRDCSIQDTVYQENLIFEYIGTDNKTALTVKYDNTWNTEKLEFDTELAMELPHKERKLSVDGIYQDVIPGEGYTLKINTASFEADGQARTRAAGSIALTSGMESVQVPEQSVELLKMDNVAIYSMIQEVIASVRKQLLLY